MAMDGSNANKRTVHAQGEAESSAKRQNVTMGLETLDCPLCFKPLRPPIYQCSVGHFICSSCRGKILDKKCYLCSVRTSFKRCFGMEHVVQSVAVPCSNASHGCDEKVSYYEKEEHEKACQKAPCFCPESGCGFVGPTVALLDHFTSQHKFHSTTFEFGRDVSLRLQPGRRVLRCGDNSQLFLLNMSSEPFGHAISVFCIQPNVREAKFTCDMNYASSFATGHNITLSFKIRSSSRFDGLPTVYDLILPKGQVSEEGNEGIMLKTTIQGNNSIFPEGSSERRMKKICDDEDDVPVSSRSRPRARRRTVEESDSEDDVHFSSRSRPRARREIVEGSDSEDDVPVSFRSRPRARREIVEGSDSED